MLAKVSLLEKRKIKYNKINFKFNTLFRNHKALDVDLFTIKKNKIIKIRANTNPLSKSPLKGLLNDYPV